MAKTRSASTASRTSSSASATLVASGLSQITWNPACNAAVGLGSAGGSGSQSPPPPYRGNDCVPPRTSRCRRRSCALDRDRSPRRTLERAPARTTARPDQDIGIVEPCRDAVHRTDEGSLTAANHAETHAIVGPHRLNPGRACGDWPRHPWRSRRSRRMPCRLCESYDRE